MKVLLLAVIVGIIVAVIVRNGMTIKNKRKKTNGDTSLHSSVIGKGNSGRSFKQAVPKKNASSNTDIANLHHPLNPINPINPVNPTTPIYHMDDADKKELDSVSNESKNTDSYGSNNESSYSSYSNDSSSYSSSSSSFDSGSSSFGGD